MITNETQWLTPLETVLNKLYIRQSELARRLKVTPITVWRWKKNNGIIPHIYHEEILKFAIERKLKLKPNDLLIKSLIKYLSHS